MPDQILYCQHGCEDSIWVAEGVSSAILYCDNCMATVVYLPDKGGK